MKGKKLPLAQVLRHFPMGQPPPFHVKIQEIQNTTTRTAPIKEARLVELLEQGIIIEVPQKTGAKGHHVSLSIRVEFKETTCTIPLTASIVAQESVNKTQTLTLHFIQIEKFEWSALQELLQQSQTNVENLFQRLKA